MEGARDRVLSTLDKCREAMMTNGPGLKSAVRDSLGRYLFEKRDASHDFTVDHGSLTV